MLFFDIYFFFNIYFFTQKSIFLFFGGGMGDGCEKNGLIYKGSVVVYEGMGKMGKKRLKKGEK